MAITNFYRQYTFHVEYVLMSQSSSSSENTYRTFLRTLGIVPTSYNNNMTNIFLNENENGRWASADVVVTEYYHNNPIASLST